MQSARDIPLLITSAASSSERRITPSWSIAQLKAKLESVTGIPPSAQRLLLRTADQQERPIEADDEEHVQVGQWPLIDYAEIHVSCTKQCGNDEVSCRSIDGFSGRTKAEDFDRGCSCSTVTKKQVRLSCRDPGIWSSILAQTTSWINIGVII